jgi:hypothetical protein
MYADKEDALRSNYIKPASGHGQLLARVLNRGAARGICIF